MTLGPRTASGGAPQRVAEAHGDRLFTSTFALLISNGTTMVLGVAFWIVAARLFTPNELGRGVHEVAAMTICANVGLLNLVTIFPRFLHPAGAKAGILLRRGYAASTSLALLATLCYFGITSFVTHQSYVPSGWGARVFFLEGVLLWVIFTIEDPALVGLRRSFVVPIENTSFSIAKVALLPCFFLVARADGVFDAWVLPLAACVAAVNVYLFGYALPKHIDASGGAGILPTRRIFTNFVAAEYLGGLALNVLWNLPALFLTTSQAAYFQTPWIAATSFDLLLFSFATGLVAEASSRPSVAAQNVRRAVRLAAMLLGPALVVLVLGAPYFLDLLGTGYSQHGTWLMRYVVLALPFMGVNVLYVVFARLGRRARRLFLVPTAIAAIILTLARVLLGPLGLTGVGLAFLVGHAVVCATVLPSVIRQYRRPGMSPSYSSSALVVEDGSRQPGDELAGGAVEWVGDADPVA